MSNHKIDQNRFSNDLNFTDVVLNCSKMSHELFDRITKHKTVRLLSVTPTLIRDIGLIYLV